MRGMLTAALVLALGMVGAATPFGGDHVQAQSDAVREIEIVVDGGYSPSRIVVREGEHIRLRFVRHESSSCTSEVVLPWLGVRRVLPPHQPVIIDVPPMQAGEHEFHCGMNMVHGTLVVTAV